jgi:hypothetical protein
MAGTTTARGYGYGHQRLRAALLPQAYGTPCPHHGVDPLCPGLMLPGQDLDLDHTDDRTSYRGMAHASCNRRAGGRKGNAWRARESDPEDPCVSRSW